MTHLPDIHLALYQPDIPQNVGAAMRLCACMGVTLDIIEPCGFIWKDKEFKRTGMDYTQNVDVVRHTSWQAFLSRYPGRRLLLMTTKSAQSYYDTQFKDGDILLMGRESAGVPDEVHEFCDRRLTIPMREGQRSLNVVNAASLVLGEVRRQIPISRL